MRSGAERQSAHLQITVFNLQDRTRIRDVVAMAIIVAMKEHGFEVGPKLKHAIDLVQSDLLRSLERLGVRNAEAEAKPIMGDVMGALCHELVQEGRECA
jgi:hypothetical protein